MPKARPPQIEAADPSARKTFPNWAKSNPRPSIPRDETTGPTTRAKRAPWQPTSLFHAPNKTPREQRRHLPRCMSSQTHTSLQSHLASWPEYPNTNSLNNRHCHLGPPPMLDPAVRLPQTTKTLRDRMKKRVRTMPIDTLWFHSTGELSLSETHVASSSSLQSHPKQNPKQNSNRTAARLQIPLSGPVGNSYSCSRFSDSPLFSPQRTMTL
mmetsp:Transcript_11378/g.20778  ORF Transcript_11378/g.20778 Transcript_11378/m.20778 type:complete len:211 (-) Transcript_11378:98-730(-)